MGGFVELVSHPFLASEMLLVVQVPSILPAVTHPSSHSLLIQVAFPKDLLLPLASHSGWI